VFIVENGPGGLDKLAFERKAEDVFLVLLGRFNAQQRTASPNPGKSYAPTVFAGEPEASGINSKALAGAMSRLFAADKIHIRKYGPPSRERTQIMAGGKA
jgi:hypothetical protein